MQCLQHQSSAQTGTKGRFGLGGGRKGKPGFRAGGGKSAQDRCNKCRCRRIWWRCSGLGSRWRRRRRDEDNSLAPPFQKEWMISQMSIATGKYRVSKYVQCNEALNTSCRASFLLRAYPNPDYTEGRIIKQRKIGSVAVYGAVRRSCVVARVGHIAWSVLRFEVAIKDRDLGRNGAMFRQTRSRRGRYM